MGKMVLKEFVVVIMVVDLIVVDLIVVDFADEEVKAHMVVK